MKHKGFTVVELIIVIVVIAILASITIVSYTFMVDDAMDTRIRSSVRSVGDAISLYEAKETTVLVTNSMFHYTSVPSVDNTLVPKYLKADYRSGLSSKNALTADNVLYWRRCNDGGGGFVVYAALNNPTSEDVAKMQDIISKCNEPQAYTFNKSGMGADLNYAQLF